jgi:hypothetical protein
MKTTQFSWNSDRFPPVFGELSLVPAPSPPTIDPQSVSNFVADWVGEKESYLYLPGEGAQI